MQSDCSRAGSAPTTRPAPIRRGSRSGADLPSFYLRFMITKISDPFAVMNRGRSVYDLHAHILPGVDDGPKTAQDTLEMARVAAANGTTATSPASKRNPEI